MSSGAYTPDDSAKPQPPWDVIFLSNRDVCDQVPISYVTRPGVSIQAACFGSNVYDPTQAQRCISNLIAAHFERFTLDLYWDTGNRQWGLCPVQIPTAGAQPTSARSDSKAPLTTNGGQSAASMVMFEDRQVTVNNDTLIGATRSSKPKTGTSGTSSGPVPTTTALNGDTLYEIGKYQCSPDLNLGWISSLFTDYFSQTSDTVSANFLMTDINLHMAASYPETVPTGQSGNQPSIPSNSNSISSLLGNSFSDFMYTPDMLQTERADLNSSWFIVDAGREPLLEYFHTSTLPNGDLTTPDGWPSLGYILMTKARRMMFSWGTIDFQLNAYDRSVDRDTVFLRNATSSFSRITTTSADQISLGCFYSTSHNTSLSVHNSSWATTPDTSPASSLTPHLTACGISPLLNTTLASTSPSTNISPYLDYVHATTWSWAPGEPRNSSSSNPNLTLSDSPSQFRCAVLDPNTRPFPGRWRVENCQAQHRVACRYHSQPYGWTLSSRAVAWAFAPSACPAGSSFAIPRTALENTFLYHAVLNITTGSPNPTNANTPQLPAVYIATTSLSVPGCWVPGRSFTSLSSSSGSNNFNYNSSIACPYYEDAHTIQQRTVLVPTIAAIIVLILTVLTGVVKCNVNRTRDKRGVRRRRKVGGRLKGLVGGEWFDGIPA